MRSPIQRSKNRIQIAGDFKFTKQLQFLLATIHQAINELKYEDLIFDFSQCRSAFPEAMIGLCAQVLSYRKKGIDFSLDLPQEPRASRLFTNANWANLIEPEKYSISNFTQPRQLKALQFSNTEELSETIRLVVETILHSVNKLQRTDFAALEWAVSELTDNVLTHANSSVGGLVQVSAFPQTQKVTFVVADAGESIPGTLRRMRPSIGTDTEALSTAIQKGVTRDIAIGQGNGLFGSSEICRRSGGEFKLKSGFAELRIKDQSEEVEEMQTRYSGTLVVCTIPYSDAHRLETILGFSEKGHTLDGLLETHFEDVIGDIHYKPDHHRYSFGNRRSGERIHQAILNLVNMAELGRRVIVDLSDIPFMSSSFADEVFGKLYLLLGAAEFSKCVVIRNASPTVDITIKIAISQRKELI